MFHQREDILKSYIILKSKLAVVFVDLIAKIANCCPVKNHVGVCWQIIMNLNVIQAVFNIVLSVRLQEKVIVLSGQHLAVRQLFAPNMAKIWNS